MRTTLQMPTRRNALQQGMVLAGLLVAVGYPQFAHAAFNQEAFNSKSVQEAVKAYGASGISESKEVVFTGPDVAENGAVVPVTASTNLKGVKQLLILVEKNPTILVAMFNVSDAIEANFSTRIKMNETSNVFAVAIMTDGKALFAKKEVKVTLGSCGA
jgi:sulfur-oxidizing protein SoxY